MTFEFFSELTTVSDKVIFEAAKKEFEHLKGITPDIFCLVWTYRNQCEAFGELRLLMSIERQEWAMEVKNTVYDPEYRKQKYEGIKNKLIELYQDNWNSEKGIWSGRKQFALGVDKELLKKKASK